jgi:sugar phosphate isomerase/epimerase
MKIAASSASFARAIAEGRLTQLEWLDLCANELEVDGAVFDAAHFPRTDSEYLAQLKKLATDLGLCVAAIAAVDLFSDAGDAHLELALALGAPIAVGGAPAASEDPAAWGNFAEVARARAASAKRLGVTLALRNAPQTLCLSGSDLRRLAKDVDSAWLRFAPDLAALPGADEATTLLPKTVLAFHAIENLAAFATPSDTSAPAFIRALARLRAFIVLENADPWAPPHAYHHALERFAALRAKSLTAAD